MEESLYILCYNEQTRSLLLSKTNTPVQFAKSLSHKMGLVPGTPPIPSHFHHCRMYQTNHKIVSFV